ncbi:MAG: dTDP-4-dehydrorhamnose 3,5-epimerase [Candidatus Omnitrophica bacterium]|nr:dTDP-4-dehydrorhamnose 3,5-epimerase [Candidatus Omnitrophota bacterium]MCB9784508.1 dTDP-4-dehydrorhamnose 3,5-epimerase [Candidatus Omnitrophota bacterium]
MVQLTPTEIEDVLLVVTRYFRDDRGFFTETYSQKNWSAEGFDETFLQDNMSLSAKGTLRGMHYQIEPHGMGKLIRAITGSIFDVAVDLREGSPTFGKWVGRTLSAENGLAMWVPVGFAHGFLALEDQTLIYYKCTNTYAPDSERSVHYADPEIGIEWPMEPTGLSPKDEAAPLLRDAEFNFKFEK